MARLDPIKEDAGDAEGGGPEGGDTEMFSPEPLFAPWNPLAPERDDPSGSDRPSSDWPGSGQLERPGQDPKAGVISDGAKASPSQTRPAWDSVPDAVSPQQTANPLPMSLAEAIQSLERTFIDTNQQILDALKAPRAAPNRRPWRRSLAIASVAALLGAAVAGWAVAGGATFAAVGGHPARASVTDPRLQSWADSWAYLWRTTTGFQACWTKHAQTKQPQTCTITLGTAPSRASGS